LLFCIFTLSLTLSVAAQDNSQERAVQKMADSGGNESTIFNILMRKIEGVEKAVGKSLGVIALDRHSSIDDRAQRAIKIG
jgi:hypothetical protein